MNIKADQPSVHNYLQYPHPLITETLTNNLDSGTRSIQWNKERVPIQSDIELGQGYVTNYVKQLQFGLFVKYENPTL